MTGASPGVGSRSSTTSVPPARSWSVCVRSACSPTVPGSGRAVRQLPPRRPDPPGALQTASTAHKPAIGSSGKVAEAIATAAEPGADVVISNQASMTSNVEVTAAGRHSHLWRRISATPVVISPTASMPSSPAHATGQCSALMVDGSILARTKTHGIMPRPARSIPRPSQLVAARRCFLFCGLTGRRRSSGRGGRMAAVHIRSTGPVTGWLVKTPPSHRRATQRHGPQARDGHPSRRQGALTTACPAGTAIQNHSPALSQPSRRSPAADCDGC